MRAEDYSLRQQELAGWEVIVESYRLGDTYYCTISSVDPGARFARAQGSTREEAERTALDKAARWLAQTRRFPTNPQAR
ncbi:MAG TPA: hypothetical protein VF136_08390 [Methylomirabilota bacterium]